MLQVSHGLPPARRAARQWSDHARAPRPPRADAFCHFGERIFQSSQHSPAQSRERVLPLPGTRRRCHSLNTPISPPASEIRLQEEEEERRGSSGRAAITCGSHQRAISSEESKSVPGQMAGAAGPGLGAAGSLMSCFHLEQPAPKAAELAGNMSGCAGQDGHPGQGMSPASPSAHPHTELSVGQRHCRLC